MFLHKIGLSVPAMYAIAKEDCLFYFLLFTPMPQINTGTVLKYETLANLFSAEFFPCFILF